MMMMVNSSPERRFAVFILTHGRADRVITYDSLRKHGYTGEIYIIIDDEDDSAPEYYRRYGKQVIMFDKAAVGLMFDEADLIEDRRTITYARNACFQIARDLGLTHFIELDDDYPAFAWKFSRDLTYGPERQVKDLDAVFEAMLDFYEGIPRLLTVAMAQGGDFIGGSSGQTGRRLTLKRKAMNSFLCSVDRPFQFVGRFNEDVNTYVTLGNRGGLFFTFCYVMLHQKPTQAQSGGISELYKRYGTYTKSFYTVMMAPSCVIVSAMGDKHPRLHHHIDWDSAVPCIVPESCRKLRAEEQT